MVDKSFEGTRWIITSTNRNEPVEWNEFNLTFFSEFSCRKVRVGHFHNAANSEFN